MHNKYEAPELTLIGEAERSGHGHKAWGRH